MRSRTADRAVVLMGVPGAVGRAGHAEVTAGEQRDLLVGHGLAVVVGTGAGRRDRQGERGEDNADERHAGTAARDAADRGHDPATDR
jgi:hypothetical protein